MRSRYCGHEGMSYGSQLNVGIAVVAVMYLSRQVTTGMCRLLPVKLSWRSILVGVFEAKHLHPSRLLRITFITFSSSCQRMSSRALEAHLAPTVRYRLGCTPYTDRVHDSCTVQYIILCCCCGDHHLKPPYSLQYQTVDSTV